MYKREKDKTFYRIQYNIFNISIYADLKTFSKKKKRKKLLSFCLILQKFLNILELWILIKIKNIKPEITT